MQKSDVKGDGKLYELFRAEVKKELFLQKKDYKFLAQETGLKPGTIRAFMCGARPSDTTAKLIARALGMKL